MSVGMSVRGAPVRRPFPVRPSPAALLLGIILLLAGCREAPGERLDHADFLGTWVSVPAGKTLRFSADSTLYLRDGRGTYVRGGWFIAHDRKLMLFAMKGGRRHFLKSEYRRPDRLELRGEPLLAGSWKKRDDDFRRYW